MVTLEEAYRVITAATQEAKNQGQPMNIAVVDEGGNLLAFGRMDGAWIGSIDIAIKKAWTSRAFDIETIIGLPILGIIPQVARMGEPDKMEDKYDVWYLVRLDPAVSPAPAGWLFGRQVELQVPSDIVFFQQNNKKFTTWQRLDSDSANKVGSGDKSLEDGFADAARHHQGAVGCVFAYDEGLAHLIQGGADFLHQPVRQAA